MQKLIDKKAGRLRRAKRARQRIRESAKPRLTVHRTPRHIYAQVIRSEDGSNRVVAQASTLDKSLRGQASGNIAAAAQVGRLIAVRATGAGIELVAFDRSGLKYHGRVMALANAAREGGLRF